LPTSLPKLAWASAACAESPPAQQHAEDPNDIVGLPPPGRVQLSNSPDLRVWTATRVLQGDPIPEPADAKRKRIDLDAREAELRHVAELLADVGEVSIVIPDDVKGKVTVQLKNVPWDDALQQVLASKGYAFDRKEQVLTVHAGPPSASPAPAPAPTP
jgi:type II secretory pathway component HofQ